MHTAIVVVLLTVGVGASCGAAVTSVMAVYVMRRLYLIAVPAKVFVEWPDDLEPVPTSEPADEPEPKTEESLPYMLAPDGWVLVRTDADVAMPHEAHSHEPPDGITLPFEGEEVLFADHQDDRATFYSSSAEPHAAQPEQVEVDTSLLGDDEEIEALEAPAELEPIVGLDTPEPVTLFCGNEYSIEQIAHVFGPVIRGRRSTNPSSSS